LQKFVTSKIAVLLALAFSLTGCIDAGPKLQTEPLKSNSDQQNGMGVEFCDSFDLRQMDEFRITWGQGDVEGASAIWAEMSAVRDSLLAWTPSLPDYVVDAIEIVHRNLGTSDFITAFESGNVAAVAVQSDGIVEWCESD
jgi:hypothetical protein